MDASNLISLAYLVASVLFIMGLKGLTHPRTAVRGNLTGALGMFIAIVAVLFDKQIVGFQGILVGVVIGSLIGAVLAIRIQMTAMPQFVALCNGFGGLASVLVAGAAVGFLTTYSGVKGIQVTTATGASGLIGAVTFSGSLIAFGKLQELISGNSVVFPGDVVLKALTGLVSLGLMGYLFVDPSANIYWALVAVALVFGILLTIPIGGADMPVVIALLNSYSGLAAASTGFVINNSILIIAGSLVGASGVILTMIMCKAMNRSLGNVIFGGAIAGDNAAPQDDIYEGRVKATSADEVVMLFENARRVVFVPGYGLAAAQAQHAVRDVATLLAERGIEVEYAIHPVAGRMPGHMNVLLAESNVPYDQLKEMDEINPTLGQVDVCVVIGANDVVNPIARTDPNSPIAGMPIINVDEARTVIVIKRSLSPGFAGIPNPLFAADNTLMLFGDGKKALLDMVAALKEAA